MTADDLARLQAIARAIEALRVELGDRYAPEAHQVQVFLTRSVPHLAGVVEG